MIYVVQIAAFLAASSLMIYMGFTENGYIIAGIGFGAAYFLTVTLPEWWRKLSGKKASV